MFAARMGLLAAVVIWGWTFVATKICLAFLSPVELLGLRLLIALPVLGGLLAWRGIPFRPDRFRWGILAGGGLIGIHFLIQITGLKYTSATNTGWIIAVTPLVMALLAFLILKEEIGLKTVGGILISTLGILTLISGGHPGNLGWLGSRGDWMVLASAHTWALYTIVTRHLSRSNPPLVVTFWVLALPAVLALGYMAWFSDWESILRLPAEPVIALLFLAVFGMALAQWFWQEGTARVGATEAGTFLYLEPLATTALAVPYLGEEFGILTGVGGLLVVGGVWWAQRRPRHPKPDSSPGDLPP